ncbi:MAG: hypothetical protein RL208_454 [Pseudomonadota bacterium]|jgi:AGCS family alanine or glycine:cation symporter
MNVDGLFEVIAEIGNNLLFFNVSPFKQFPLPFLIFWLIGGSVYVAFKLKFFNFFALPKAIWLFITEKSKVADNNTASSKTIVISSIAGATDLGSIFGVATIVATGGAGTIFWMIVAGIISTSLRFVEVLCGHFFRRRQYSNGKFIGFIGGPQVYINRIFKIYKMPQMGLWVAKIYAFNVAISTFCSLQVNQTVHIITHLTPFLKNYNWIISLFVATFIISLVIGGFSRIAKFNLKIVPIMVVMYLFITAYILFANASNIIPSLHLIINDALSFRAINSSISAMIILGAQRAFFCNESGMGSGAIIHANSSNENSIKEAIISMITPIVSVLVVCSCSGLIVLTTGVYNSVSSTSSGVEFILMAFTTVNENMKYFVLLIVPLFAITTAVSWAYYGSRSWMSLFGLRYVPVYYLILFISYYLCGLVDNFQTILDVADVLNLSISIPNIIALVMFIKIARRFKKLKKLS